MARINRIIAPGSYHHVTQKGNNGEPIFLTAEDRLFYLQLLKRHALQSRIAIAGFCLMTNHVHLVARPESESEFSRWIQRAHGEYAQAFNDRRRRRGHLWQNRFYSCVLDKWHILNALKYVDLNPVRARIVDSAVHWQWSSATAHALGQPDDFGLLSMDWLEWRDQPDWSALISDKDDEETNAQIRRYTRANLPLGSAAFVSDLERRTGRRLVLQDTGREPAAYPANR